MSKITSIANGADPVQQQAASDGIAVQAAVISSQLSAVCTVTC